MDLEEIKRNWNSITPPNAASQSTTPIQFDFGKKKTAQQRLVRYYRRLSILSAIFIVVSLTNIYAFFDNIWLSVAFAAYFAMSAAMDFILQRRVGRIDLAEMTVSDVARSAASCRRLHHIFQIVLIPCAILLIGFMIYVATDDVWVIYGVAAGAAIGLAIGLRIYFKMMSQYRSLMRSAAD